MNLKPIRLLVTMVGYASSVAILIAGVSKSTNYADFYDSLSEWHIMNIGAVAVVGMTAPFVEMASASLWLLGIYRNTLNYILALMIVAYTFAILWEHQVSGSVQCSCFASFFDNNSEPSELGWYTFRNTLIAFPFFILVFFQATSRTRGGHEKL